MRLLGTTLMGFGGFCLSVVLASVLGPMLRSMGIEIQAETTSVIGTAIIGVFSLTTGMLMRRRVAEAEARNLETLRGEEERRRQLPSEPAAPLRQGTRERDDARPRRT